MPNWPTPPSTPPSYFSSEIGLMEKFCYLMKGLDSTKWMAGNIKGIERLEQDIKTDHTKETKAIFFMYPHEIPKGRKPTYLRVIITYCPQKYDPYRDRWIVWYNLIYYLGNKYTQNIDITITTFLFNSAVSMLEGCSMTIDFNNLYFNTPMARCEYMSIPLTMIRTYIIE